jgi:hypothetical protein
VNSSRLWEGAASRAFPIAHVYVLTTQYWNGIYPGNTSPETQSFSKRSTIAWSPSGEDDIQKFSLMIKKHKY